ncbi:MAG TPA: secondary thiamine-phosphate synthase enzyme YjbQ [Methanoregulaceae archaeon]|nr:secondary thiamine-phosphate synthase enzyme YjbQ [Methanoregulaceae archaeon]HOV66764.1 secondary thiamine-phosphate synthase enzyme YjbQ [Methanoregulaceae archaeon]HQJ87314.1 secondary thiamine-phosphate synthase enzyme YjbQ [Methanoregulaceae archaeon]
MFTKELSIPTRGEGMIVDLTSRIAAVVGESGIQDGVVHLFVQGSTAALTTIEYEEGVLQDLRRALRVIAPDEQPYAHDAAWGDGNGRSHVRAALVGPSLTIPVRQGRLMVGTWQQVVLLELDVRPSRTRRVSVTILA